eukprot:1622278-Prorocentrum_lima.AAC.1
MVAFGFLTGEGFDTSLQNRFTSRGYLLRVAVVIAMACCRKPYPLPVTCDEHYEPFAPWCACLSRRGR